MAASIVDELEAGDRSHGKTATATNHTNGGCSIRSLSTRTQ
jgi:hypothetical protein